MKRLTGIFFIFLTMIGQTYPVIAQDVTPVMINNGSGYSFQGHAELTKGNEQLNANIFTGESTEVKKGTNLKMSLSTIINTGYSESEDEFFAQINNDLSTDGGVIIPAGSFAHGTIDSIAKAKRLGRNGYVNLNFDYIMTPDGRKIPIEASMTTKANPVAATAKNIAKDTGYTLGGGVMGSWVALNMLGLPAAVASHGATVAGGAGIGAIAGLGIALSQKGQEVLITQGDEINVKIKTSMELPIMRSEIFKEEEIFCDGLNIQIYNIKIEKDPFGQPNVITLSMLIDNHTNKTFSVFDMALLSDLKNIYYPSPFNNTDFWFDRINPGDKVSTKISFAVGNPKRKHWLVIYDNYTRKPMVKLSLENTKRELAENKKLNRKHVKENTRNNFYVPVDNELLKD